MWAAKRKNLVYEKNYKVIRWYNTDLWHLLDNLYWIEIQEMKLLFLESQRLPRTPTLRSVSKTLKERPINRKTSKNKASDCEILKYVG